MIPIQKPYSPRTVPGATWPLPKLRRATYALDGSGWISRVGNVEHVDCPPELHLREFSDTDARDPRSLLALVDSVGLPLMPSTPWSGMVGSSLPPHLKDAQYRRSVEHAAEQLGLPKPNLDDRPFGDAAHVAEIGYRTVFIHLLTKHLVAVRSGLPAEKVWEGSGFFRDLDGPADPVEEVGELSATHGAWYMFRGYLNDGLSTVSPRIEEPEGLFEGGPIDNFADAYTAACICIFNDVIEALPYKRCAYEKCARVFRHQLGPSGGKFRKSEGVTFCTPQHARNQSQLARRREKRSQRATDAPTDSGTSRNGTDDE